MMPGSFPSKNAALLSRSPEETIAAGERLGALLEAGDVVALEAPLGAGKTVFAKGIARALGVRDVVTSPTFTIISEYEGERCPLYHIDAYRLAGSDDFYGAGGGEALFGGGVSVIEWSERIAPLLPPSTITIKLTILKDTQREIKRI